MIEKLTGFLSSSWPLFVKPANPPHSADFCGSLLSLTSPFREKNTNKNTEIVSEELGNLEFGFCDFHPSEGSTV